MIQKLTGHLFVVALAVAAVASSQGCALENSSLDGDSPYAFRPPTRDEDPAASTVSSGTKASASTTSGKAASQLSEHLCPVGEERCGEICVDTTVSLQHCGACGNTCASGRVCTPDNEGGASCALACVGGTKRCGNSCTRTESDPNNCGACGSACAPGQACINNMCAATACAPRVQELCYSGPEDTLGMGACRPGRKTCNEFGTAFSACTGEVLPRTEICGDGVDNDCDGQVDEGCANTLTVVKSGTGAGVVTSSTPGISCGSACSSPFPLNSTVQLFASPAAGHSFNWTGSCSGSGVCIVSMDQARFVGVTFTAPASCSGRRVTTSLVGSTTSITLPVTPGCAATTIQADTSTSCGRISALYVNGAILGTATSTTGSSTTFSIPAGSPLVDSVTVSAQRIYYAYATAGTVRTTSGTYIAASCPIALTLY